MYNETRAQILKEVMKKVQSLGYETFTHKSGEGEYNRYPVYGWVKSKDGKHVGSIEIDNFGHIQLSTCLNNNKAGFGGFRVQDKDHEDGWSLHDISEELIEKSFSVVPYGRWPAKSCHGARIGQWEDFDEFRQKHWCEIVPYVPDDYDIPEIKRSLF